MSNEYFRVENSQLPEVKDHTNIEFASTAAQCLYKVGHYSQFLDKKPMHRKPWLEPGFGIQVTEQDAPTQAGTNIKLVNLWSWPLPIPQVLVSLDMGQDGWQCPCWGVPEPSMKGSPAWPSLPGVDAMYIRHTQTPTTRPEVKVPSEKGPRSHILRLAGSVQGVYHPF